MSDSVRINAAKKSGADEAEATLRLIANLPAPHGLEDRVHAHLLAAPRSGRVVGWPASHVRPSVRESGWLRSAAAAAIVCVVAGGGWGIYARVQGGQVARSIAGPGTTGSSSFSTGEARRRPQTLNGPAVTHPPETKMPQSLVAPKGVSRPAAAKTHTAQTKPVVKDDAPASAPQVQ
jgi:hypothetical protein